MKGLRLGLSLTGRRFQPSSLFSGGEAGAWYDPSDLSSMFQDSGGATPAAVGQPVGYIADKSGRGNHATQATTASKPTLRQDASGNYYLEFDGVDDWLRATFAISKPWDRVSATRQIGWTVNDRILDGATTDVRLYQSGTSPELRIFDGAGLVQGVLQSPAVGVNAVLSEKHGASQTSLTVNNGTTYSAVMGAAVPGGITIAANPANASCGNIRIYGICMVGRDLAASEIVSLRSFMANKSGVTL